MVTISNHKHMMIDHYIKGMLLAHPHLAKVPKNRLSTIGNTIQTSFPFCLEEARGMNQHISALLATAC